MDRVKPTVQLTGTDSNVFMLLGRCTQALKRSGQPEVAQELKDKVMKEARDFDHALQIMMSYVDAE